MSEKENYVGFRVAPLKYAQILREKNLIFPILFIALAALLLLFPPEARAHGVAGTMGNLFSIAIVATVGVILMVFVLAGLLIRMRGGKRPGREPSRIRLAAMEFFLPGIGRQLLGTPRWYLITGLWLAAVAALAAVGFYIEYFENRRVRMLVFLVLCAWPILTQLFAALAIGRTCKTAR